MKSAGIAILLIFPSIARSQQGPRITGFVTDPANHVVSGVTIQLLNERYELVGVTRSDTAGAYAFTVSVSGAHRLRGRRIGFQPFESPRLIIQADVPTLYDIDLVPIAQELAGVVVRAATNRWGFAQRAGAGGRHAHFVDSAALASKDRRSIGRLFDQLSGTAVRVGLERGCERACDMVLIGPKRCPATVYIDGWWTPPNQVIRTVDAKDIRGVEVYDLPHLAPRPFTGSPRSSCPVVLIWTDAGFEWEPRNWLTDQYQESCIPCFST